MTAAICHDGIAKGYQLSDEGQQRLELIVATAAGPVSGHIFSDGSHDFECFTAPPTYYCEPQYADCGPRILDQLRYEHYADRVDDQHLIANAGSPGGMSIGDLSYVVFWGAISSKVARLSVTIGTTDLTTAGDAVIQNGYFMALFDAKPCCLVTYVAYDDAGAILDQR